MKKLISLGSVAVVAFSAHIESADAFVDVCTLANTEVPSSIRANSVELSTYKEKLKAECELSEKYQQMVLKARTFNITLEQISEYQALRYIERSYYEHARASGTPVPVVYQLFKSDYDKPMEQRSTVIWDGFQIGIRQLDSERARIVAGGRLEVQDLLRIHKGFYTLSDEDGDFSNEPYPGKLKPPSPNDVFWWRLESGDADRVIGIVRDVNETFVSYGLLSAGNTEVIRVRQLSEGEYAMYGGDSRENVANLEHLLAMMNSAFAQARAGQHMVWGGKLVTPMDVALLSQQLFVDIHPFFEGNGRTSRFLQELVLTSFAMPHGASGDLMREDVLTRQGDYYLRALLKTRMLLGSVDVCLETTYNAEARAGDWHGVRSAKGQSSKPATPVNAKALNQAALDYGCRILN